MKQTKRKKNYVISCIAKEFRFLWVYYVVAAFFVFGFIIYFAISSEGAAFGLSNITTQAQLEKFFAHPNNTGRLHADSVYDVGQQVELTGKEKKNFSFQVGGAYVETPSITVSTYNKTYDIYVATLQDSVVIVLFGDIFRKDWAGLQYCDVIEIYSEDIGEKQKLVDEMKQAYPDFFGQFKSVYVAKGDYTTDLLTPGVVILAVFLLLAAVLYGFPYLYPIQRISYMGRQIAKLAKAEGRSFKEMCERLNEYEDRALYKNGLEMLSERYVVIRETKKLVTQTQERMKIYSLDGTYGAPYIENITIMSGMYPDEMNDIHVMTVKENERKVCCMTVHKTRQEVEEILAQMGFREIT